MEIKNNNPIMQNVMERLQGQRHIAASQDAREKFKTTLRGQMSIPAASGPSQGGLPTLGGAPSRTRSIPAAFQNAGIAAIPNAAPTAVSAAPASIASTASAATASTASAATASTASAATAAPGAAATSSAATNSGAFSTLSVDQANQAWYGANGGSPVAGIYSEKASYGGMAGIGHPNYATVATGENMVISVTGLHGKNPAPTRVMALDSDAVLKANGGVWPGTPAEMQQVLKNNPQCIVADVQANPPQMVNVSGVPAGTKVTMLVGAELIMNDPPKRPPGSQAMITNMSQLPANLQALVPKESIMAGGTQAMMKAQAEMTSRSMARAAAEKAAHDGAHRMGVQVASHIAGEGAAKNAAVQAQSKVMGAATESASSSSVRGGNPPVKIKGFKRGAPGVAEDPAEIARRQQQAAQDAISLPNMSANP